MSLEPVPFKLLYEKTRNTHFRVIHNKIKMAVLVQFENSIKLHNDKIND